MFTRTIFFRASTFTLALFAIGALELGTAYAHMDETDDPSAINANSFQQEISCDDICGQIHNDTLEGPWTTRNDQWCADHGSATERSVPASQDLKLLTDKGCPYPITQTDLNRFGGDVKSACRAIARGMNECKLRNTQVETQCQARNKMRSADSGEKGLLKLDYVATGACAAACAVGYMNGAAPAAGATGLTKILQQGCGYAAEGEGAFELLGAIFVKQGNLSRVVSGVGGTLGIDLGRKILKGGGTTAPSEGTSTSPSRSTTPSEGTSPGTGTPSNPNIPPITSASNDLGPSSFEVSSLNPIHNYYLEGTLAFFEAASNVMVPKAYAGGGFHGLIKDQSPQALTCKAAILFGAMTGLRAHNVKSNQGAEKKACDQVQELYSQAHTPSTPEPYDYNYGNGAQAGGTTYGGSGGYSGGTTTGSSGTVGVGGDSGTQGSGSVPPQMRESVDGQMLARSGLDKILAQKAASIDPNQLVQAATNGQLGSSLASGFGAGQVGDMMGKIADVAYNEHPHLSLNPNVEGTAYAQGGGGAAKPAAAKGPDFGLGNLGNLFGSGGAPKMQTGARSLSFKQPEDTDIWHSHTDENIFQIVSGRISKTTAKMASPAF